MTNYPTNAPSFWEFPLLIALQIGWIALGMITFDPRQWATRHEICIDLPSAWWMAYHSWEYSRDYIPEDNQ